MATQNQYKSFIFYILAVIAYILYKMRPVAAADFTTEVFNAGTHQTPLKAKHALGAQSRDPREPNHYLDCQWKYHEEHEIGAIRAMCNSLNGPVVPNTGAWNFIAPEKGTVVMGAIVSVKKGVTDVAKDIPFCRWNVYCERTFPPTW